MQKRVVLKSRLDPHLPTCFLVFLIFPGRKKARSLEPGRLQLLTAHEQAVLKRGPESACRGGQGLLDLTSDPRYGSHGSAFELGHLQHGVEHSLRTHTGKSGEENTIYEYIYDIFTGQRGRYLDEGGVFKDLVGVTDEFELLHDADGGIQIQNDSCGRDPETDLAKRKQI